MSWDFTDFMISKAHAVVDIDQLNAAMMQHLNDGGRLTPEAMGLIIANLHHNMDDIEDELLNPYKADAVEMAIRSGQLLDQYARAYHAGPQDPNYENALREGLRIGIPMINDAAKRQNALNARRGIGEVPLPFVDGGPGSDPATWRVDAQHLQDVGATVAEQKNRDGSFNPFHSRTGQLVTQIISGHNLNQEGYARWYEEAAKQLGYIGVRFDKQGRVRDRKSYTIPAHFVHHNTLTINDKDMRNMIGYGAEEAHREAMAQGLNPDEVSAYMRQKLMDMPVVYRHSHMGHHNFDATYDRNSRKAEEARAIREGEMLQEDEVPAEAQPRGNEVTEDFIHPELRDTTWFNRLGQGSLNPHTTNSKNKKMIKDISEYHGIEEDRVREIIEESYRGRTAGKSYKQKILDGLYNAHLESTGGRPPDHYEGPGVQPALPPIGEEGNRERLAREFGQARERAGMGQRVEEEPEPQADPEPLPGPDRPLERPPVEVPAHIPRNEPVAPAPQNPPAPAIRNVPYVPPFNPYTEQKRNIQSLQSNIDSLGGRTKLSGLAELLGRLTPDELLLRSDEIKPEIEDYIETVQLELAKSVVDDYASLGDLSVTSPLDVALLSSKVQMGTNDVITIFHTRGDWREVAKSFNIPHSSVQMVKVALYD